MKKLFLIALLSASALGQVQRQTGVVTGRVSRNGQAAAGIRVSAMAVPEPGISVSDVAAFASVTLSESDGRYRLENLPPGRYYVTAGFLTTPTYYPGVASIDRAKAVSVSDGVTVTDIDFSTALAAGATISGRFLFPPGQAVPTKSEAYLAGPYRPLPTSALGADGAFEFSRVPPGTYNLVVPAPMKGIPVVVADADVPGMEIPIPFTVSGKVFVEGGGPLPSLLLSFVSSLPSIKPTAPSLMPNGEFSSQLPQGEYRVTVSGLPNGYTLKSMTAGNVDILSDPLKLSRAATAASIAVTLGVSSPPPWVRVNGKVAGPGFVPNGRPYQMMLQGAALLYPLNFELAVDGSFELPQVLPGDYTLSVAFPKLPIPGVPLKVENTDLRAVEIVVPAPN